MVSDYRDISDEKKENLELGKAESPLSKEGISAIQGDVVSKEEDINPSKKGSNFEHKAAEKVFGGEGQKITIRPEDNLHLDDYGDGIGITKERRIADAYIKYKDDEEGTTKGEIWEMKSGYEKGVIDRDQLYEYSLMEQAGYVKVREGENKKKVAIDSINYLFETKQGALANQPHLNGLATTWYLDENEDVQLLMDETE